MNYNMINIGISHQEIKLYGINPHQHYNNQIESLYSEKKIDLKTLYINRNKK